MSERTLWRFFLFCFLPRLYYEHRKGKLQGFFLFILLGPGKRVERRGKCLCVCVCVLDSFDK